MAVALSASALLLGAARRPAAPRGHPDRAVPCRHARAVDGSPARPGPRRAGAVLSAVGGHRRRRRRHRAELCHSGAVFSQGGRRPRQRRPRRPQHGRARSVCSLSPASSSSSGRRRRPISRRGPSGRPRPSASPCSSQPSSGSPHRGIGPCFPCSAPSRAWRSPSAAAARITAACGGDGRAIRADGAGPRQIVRWRRAAAASASVCAALATLITLLAPRGEAKRHALRPLCSTRSSRCRSAGPARGHFSPSAHSGDRGAEMLAAGPKRGQAKSKPPSSLQPGGSSPWPVVTTLRIVFQSLREAFAAHRRTSS